MNEGEPVIEARGLHKTFHDATRDLRVLRGVDLKVRAGEAAAIVGASGTGKSTLLHLLGGLDRPTEGMVLLNGQPYSSLNEEETAERRASAIGIVYQSHHLLPEFTALENVLLPGLVARRHHVLRPRFPRFRLENIMLPRLVARLSLAEARRRAAERLAEVGLADRLDHRPSRLSGGEQQRVALARALMNDPSVVLADEPTGNLDAETAREAIDLLWNSTLEKGRALIIVTHEPSIARRAERIYLLEEGRLFDRTAERRAVRSASAGEAKGEAD